MPKRPRSRAESKEATRIALIEAGMAELGKRGLDASLDAICARAKLTRGAFYVHFADREAFIVAVMEHVLGGFVAALGALGPQLGGIDRIIKLYFAAAEARAPAVAGGPALRLQHLLDACRRSPKLGATYRGLVVGARDRLAAGIRADRHARTDLAPEAVADLMIVTALGIAAMFELELPVDLARLGATTSKVIAR
jgi:AcrR family transcriptional regulator